MGTPEESSQSRERSILVTGFGPFGLHDVNASWVAVKELESLWKDRSSDLQSCTLKTREIPVVYSYVSNSLHQVYKDCRPSLCVHVGVSPYKIIKLERRGKNHGYKHLDVDGQCPVKGSCVESGPVEITTQFDLEAICESLSGKEVEFGISEDAGRYLCDFIYYKALHLHECPVVFVHVPPLEKPYSAKQLGQGLKDLLEVLASKMSTITAD
jgi:pyroglutamyl-peptidase